MTHKNPSLKNILKIRKNWLGWVGAKGGRGIGGTHWGSLSVSSHLSDSQESNAQ